LISPKDIVGLLFLRDFISYVKHKGFLRDFAPNNYWKSIPDITRLKIDLNGRNFTNINAFWFLVFGL
jgi:hypothetical protein